MKQALVTGGCGFLGSWVVRELRERGVAVRVLALPGESTENVTGVELELMRGNVLSIDDCRRAVAGVDAVFHLAAIYKDWMPDPTPMYEVAMRGTFNVLTAAQRAGVGPVVFTASIAALGRPPPGTIGDERTRYDLFDLDFAYSRSKYHSRVLAQDFAAWDLDVRTVCPGVVLGPGDLGPTPSGRLILSVLKGGPPLYVDGGAAFVDVRDAARVHVLCAERGRAGETYLAAGHNLDNLQFLHAIGRATGVSRRYFKMPVAVARRIVIAMEAAARRRGREPPLSRNFFEYSLLPSFFSNEKTRRELGAEFRPIDETIRDAVAYFRARGLIEPA